MEAASRRCAWEQGALRWSVYKGWSLSTEEWVSVKHEPVRACVWLVPCCRKGWAGIGRRHLCCQTRVCCPLRPVPVSVDCSSAARALCSPPRPEALPCSHPCHPQYYLGCPVDGHCAAGQLLTITIE